MKKLFFATILVLISFLSYCQEDSTKIIYCELVGSQFMGKVTVIIDMGESKGFLGLNSSYIIDEKTGNPRKFNSMVDAMNFMGEKKWDLIQAFAVSSSNGSVYHWILKQTILRGKDGNYYPASKKNFGN
jgi:hypothetical protein